MSWGSLESWVMGPEHPVAGKQNYLSRCYTAVRSEGNSEKANVVSDFAPRHLNISDA